MSGGIGGHAAAVSDRALPDGADRRRRGEKRGGGPEAPEARVAPSVARGSDARGLRKRVTDVSHPILFDICYLF